MRTALATVVFAAAALALAVTPSLAADSTARNKAVARRMMEEVLGGGNLALSPEIHTKDFVAHGSTRDFTFEEDFAASKGWREAFPDLRVTVDVIVAEGDKVAVRWTASGTNTGTGNGLPATGKHVVGSGLTIFRFVDGKIAEEWSSFDSLALYRQLGLAPSK
jgi:steroid delta-isomerase-like uncharacterized protein